MSQPIVLISYSRQDEYEKKKLLEHLHIALNPKNLWSEDQIMPGADREKGILETLNYAKIAILLISPNYLNSEFMKTAVIPQIRRRQEQEDLIVVPILGIACAWRKVNWLARLNIRPVDGQPVWSDNGLYANERLTAIAEEIAEMLTGTSGTTKPQNQPYHPFTYNVPVLPDGFIGRRTIINQILGNISHPARISSAISGDPRIGKTSLLHYLRMPEAHQRWHISPEQHHFIYLDCHSVTPFNEANFWRHALRAMAQLVNNDERLKTRVDQLLEQSQPDHFDLIDLFDYIARLNQLVVLLLDEFEWIVENLEDKPDFLNQLRALLNRPERGLVLITASRLPLNQLCASLDFRGSPFPNALSPISLTPFTPAEVDELLTYHRAIFSTTERNLLDQVAGTHPYLVQLAAFIIVNARDIDYVTLPQLATYVLTEFEQETEIYFTEILNYSSPQEKMLLAWLALGQLSRQFSNGTTILSNLNHLTKFYPEEIRQLFKRGLIIEQSEELTLFSPVFNWIVLQNEVLNVGEEILVKWQPFYRQILVKEQQQALSELVKDVLNWPILIKDPTQFRELSTQAEIGFMPALLDSRHFLRNYDIEGKIGSGGMANVFKARHRLLNRWVAIKKLQTIISSNEEHKVRFLREAQAIAALSHPNIVQIYEFGIQDDHYVMIMQFVEGYDLKQHLQKLQKHNQRLPREDILRIAGSVAEALDYAHQHNMIHRDVKPANILLTNDDHVFLTDFGIVRLLDQVELTQAGEIVGTPAYMAPEQLIGQNQNIDYQADIYALGCVVYEMITGYLPFEIASLPLAHLNTEPTPPDQIIPDIPKAAGQVILQALSKDPTERPASATQFIRQLQESLNL